jgi:hypothetical protein
MQMSDVDPIKLCQKIKDTYKRHQMQTKTPLKEPHIMALVSSQVKIATNVMIQMGHAGIEHSTMKPLDERKVIEIINFP